MKNQMYISRVSWHRFSVLLIFLLGTLFPSGCGNEGQDAFSVEPSESVSVSDTASASLTIRWHDALDAQQATYQRAALDCQGSGVSQVVCNVYDTASGNLLASGGPWSCTAGGGRIDNIPVGQDRTFVVLAEDIAGNVIYQGETFNVAISAGQVTEGVVVDAYRFVPTLIAPNDGDQVDPNAFSLQWEALNNADEYLVQVAQDNEFNTVVIDTTTPGAIYAPSTLASSTEYFWKIYGVDLYANIGAESETRRFVTSECTYSISSTSNTVTAEGGQGSFTVTTSTSDCEWSAVSSDSWVTITSDTSGSGRVDYTVAANSGPTRTATITVAGNDHTISQTAADCTYSISPTGQTIGGNGGSYDVSVSVNIADCEWTASENVSWISLSRTSGTGSGTVQVTVLANTGAARTATITIAGQSHRIDQDPVDCAVTIAPPSQTVSAAGVSYDVSVTATRDDCEWTASENVSWISLSRTSGSGSGTVRITVLANTGAARSATITIAGRTHTVSQADGCAYTIAPVEQTVESSGGSYDVTVTTSSNNCTWTASENSAWLSLSRTNGSGTGNVRVTVAANTGAARTATITIAGRSHTVNQLEGCTFTIAPVIRTVGAAGASYNVTVTASGGNCGWTASENSAWISLSRSTGTGTGPVGITVSANSGPARTATVSIAGQVHTVNQDPGLPVVTVTATDATAIERAEFPDPGTYRISRTGSTLSTLNVYFTMSGTADNGKDYTAINSPISIGSRRSFVDVTLVPINDQNDEPDESAHMTILNNSAYTRGASYIASVTIQDDDVSALITCTDSSGLSGDLYYRGFYVPSYPGTSLSTVVLYLHAIEAGMYNLTLTARAGTYSGTVIGSRTIEVPLSSNLASPTYFNFSQRPRVTQNSRVTFALTLNKGPTDVVYYETQTPSGCPVVQTNNTTPPLSTFRRNGIAVLIYGDRF